MRKLIIITIITMLFILIISCKKNNTKKDDILDLSIYDISDEYVYNKNDNIEYCGIGDLLSINENPSGLLISFDIEDNFYGAYTESTNLYDLVVYDANTSTYNVDGRIIYKDDFNSIKEQFNLLSKYIFEVYSDLINPDEQAYYIDKIHKITLSEYNELDENTKKQYHHYVLLSNPINIITGTSYNFSLLVKYNNIFQGIEKNEVELPFNKILTGLPKKTLNEINNIKKTIFIPFYFDKYISFPIVYDDDLNDTGILLKGIEKRFVDGIELCSYDHFYDELFRPNNNIYSFTNILKSISVESSYFCFSSFTNNEHFHENILYYSFCSLSKLKNLILNINKISKSFFEEFTDYELLSKLDSGDIITYLNRYNTVVARYNKDINIEITNLLKNKYGLKYYKFDANKNESFFICKASTKINNQQKTIYFKYDNSNEIDLYNIEKLYYICKGKIVKDLSENNELNIDIIIPIDVTKNNDLEYANKYGGECIFNIDYVYDGFLIGITNNLLEENIKKDDIVLGHDIKIEYITDLIKEDDELKLGINIIYDIYECEMPIIDNNYRIIVPLNTYDNYAGRIRFYSFNKVSKCIRSYKFSFEITNNQIIIN